MEDSALVTVQKLRFDYAAMKAVPNDPNVVVCAKDIAERNMNRIQLNSTMITMVIIP